MSLPKRALSSSVVGAPGSTFTSGLRCEMGHRVDSSIAHVSGVHLSVIKQTLVWYNIPFVLHCQGTHTRSRPNLTSAKPGPCSPRFASASPLSAPPARALHLCPILPKRVLRASQILVARPSCPRSLL